LDFLCCQGVATKLVTEFLLKYSFEQIQPRGWCVVAETPQDKSIIGIARSYVYECFVNGKKSITSYAFLMRVHPHYRRKNLAVMMTTELFYHDLQDSNIDYMSSWVVSDNLSSLAFQDRIKEVGSADHNMPHPDTIGAFRCIGFSLDDFLKEASLTLNQNIEEINLSSYSIECITDSSEQVRITKQFISTRQFTPADLKVLFNSPLNLGTYLIKDKKTGNIAAMFNVWNSGEVRVTFLRDSDFKSDGAILFYNHWIDDTNPNALALFKILVDKAARDMYERSFKFLFLFFPDNLLSYSDVDHKAKINTLWKARVWYVVNQERLDMDSFPGVFYDPRQCLV